MPIQRIENYKQQDGREILKVIIKPTKKFPYERYFYVDKCFEDLVRSYSWGVYSGSNTDYVRGKGMNLHREIAYKCLGHYPICIDHENHVGIDNVCSNLNEVTNSQNSRNRQIRGYTISEPLMTGGSTFTPMVHTNGELITGKVFYREDEVCYEQFLMELTYLSDYNYDFYKDRKNDLDILDMERTGYISSDLATIMHVEKYVGKNPWYAFRYNLFRYCKHNHIMIPKYYFNNAGRLVDENGNILCPFG